MKLQNLQEAKYSSRKDINNLLTFFEERNLTFRLREGLVAYWALEEFFEIENKDGTFFVKMENNRFREINDESVNSINVFELRKRF